MSVSASDAAAAPEVAEAPGRWTGVLPRLRRPAIGALGVVATALVTAWVFPAMTKQWDDRQKEHELKASVISDIAAASAHALVGGEAILGEDLDRTARASLRRRVGNQWELSALETEARIRTYFPLPVVQSWLIYSWAVDRFIGSHSVSAEAALQEAVSGSVTTLDPAVADAAALLLVRAGHTEGVVPSYKAVPRSRSSHTNLARLKAILSVQMRADERGQIVVSRWSALEKDLVVLEQAVADQILRSHATGFSTTAGDLIHDLEP